MSNIDSNSIKNVYSKVILKEGKYYHDELSHAFWKDKKFDPDTRQKLLTIALDFYDHLKLPAPIIDIQLTGSLANYNYTPLSDLDVHIIIDFTRINNDKELVKKAVDGMRFIWNARHNIVINGHDVEIYIQDAVEQHTSSGLFSLKNDKWIKEPKVATPEIDDRDVERKFTAYVNEIDKMDDLLKRKRLSRDEYRAIESRAARLKEKIARDRNESLRQKGEYSVENLVFKKLRNSDHLEKLINVISTAYDSLFSDRK